MATSRGTGSARNGRDSCGKRRGIKCFDGQTVKTGAIIIRQRGTKLMAGTNIKRGRDDTLFALKPGIVRFAKHSKLVSIEEVIPAK